MYKILIADDEILELDGLNYILENSQLEISQIFKASNGFEALSKAQTFQPDIAILDIQMPGMTGLEVAKLITKSVPKCKIIILTAYSDFQFAKQAIKIKVNDYVVKPVDDNELINTIQKAIDEFKIEYDKKQLEVDAEVKFQLMRDYFEKELVSTLVFFEEDEQVINEYLTLFDIKDYSGFCLVCNLDESIENNDFSQLQINIIKKRSLNKIKLILKKYYNNIFINIIDNKIFTVIFISQAYKEMINEICKEIIESIETECLITPYIGLSPPFISTKKIHQSFLKAILACHNTSTNTKINIYSTNNKSNKDYCFLQRYEKILYEKIIMCDKVNILKVENELFKWALESSLSMNKVGEQFSRLFRTVTSNVNQEIALNFTIPDFKKDFLAFHTLGQVRTYINEYLLSLINSIAESRIDDEKICLIDKACNYINKHYMEEITLEFIAEKMGFSSFYFSKIFKSYKNINFVQYLTKVRIEHGKILLRDTNLSIKEISEKIGYNNPNYFAIVFKRMELISPKKYRTNTIFIK